MIDPGRAVPGIAAPWPSAACPLAVPGRVDSPNLHLITIELMMDLLHHILFHKRVELRSIVLTYSPSVAHEMAQKFNCGHYAKIFYSSLY